MKRVYMIGGTMGIGKTATCQQLKKLLPNCVFLDGDWCWDADPFLVTEETKAMVLDNICHILNNFLHCTAYENVVFCWVLHERSVWDQIFQKLDTDGCLVKCICLTAEEAALRKRLEKDIGAGLRQPEIFDRTIARLSLYPALGIPLLDTTNLTARQAAEKIAEL